LNRFSVYQINLFPTAAQATGLVFTLAYGWLSDGLNKRWQILVVPAVSIALAFLKSYFPKKSTCYS
jgi:ACS family pantothenate transporter-like MFS transporter